ncbi:hypothetical protein OG21DRAFT_830456 [Imleria badia]|nr:hypothetical protein OG21DRAFT_830456 [Imleria badia]
MVTAPLPQRPGDIALSFSPTATAAAALNKLPVLDRFDLNAPLFGSASPLPLRIGGVGLGGPHLRVGLESKAKAAMLLLSRCRCRPA